MIAVVQDTVDPMSGAHGNSAVFQKCEHVAMDAKSCFSSIALKYELTNAVLAQIIGW